MLDKLKFNPLSMDSKPSSNTEVLIFINDKWRGYDEIQTASFDGDYFYINNIQVRSHFVVGWLELPIKLVYGCSDDILPCR